MLFAIYEAVTNWDGKQILNLKMFYMRRWKLLKDAMEKLKLIKVLIEIQ